MKFLALCVLSIAATIQPVLAGEATCWTSADGNHLVFPPSRMAVSYYHDRMAEPCDAIATNSPLRWRIWCDVSSRAGQAYFVPASTHGHDQVLWDGQTFYRDRHCGW